MKQSKSIQLRSGNLTLTLTKGSIIMITQSKDYITIFKTQKISLNYYTVKYN